MEKPKFKVTPITKPREIKESPPMISVLLFYLFSLVLAIVWILIIVKIISFGYD